MTALRNRQVLLKARPSGIPQAEHFEIVERPVGEPGDGQILVRNHYLSVEPAMRGWVSSVGNYAQPVPLGGVMRAFAVGRIVASRSPAYAVGDTVTGLFGWQEHALVDAASVQRHVDDQDLPMSTALGVLGLNGLTAYFGLLDIARPRAGQTVVVSTAAGAVGSCVGQIARTLGCRTVGIAGGPAKTALCRSGFGYDEAIDYQAGTLEADLARACPQGIDIYFDNTAGAISDAVLPQLAVGACVVICGTASVASWNPPPVGPRVERHLLVKRARMQGLLIFDYADRYAEGLRPLTEWVRSGAIRYREDVLDGIEQAPGAIAGLYRGENLGKRLIRLVDAEPLPASGRTA